jgi:hypothetical protein
MILKSVHDIVSLQSVEFSKKKITKMKVKWEYCFHGQLVAQNPLSKAPSIMVGSTLHRKLISSIYKMERSFLNIKVGKLFGTMVWYDKMHLYPKICTLSRNFLWIWPQAHNLSHLV